MLCRFGHRIWDDVWLKCHGFESFSALICVQICECISKRLPLRVYALTLLASFWQPFPNIDFYINFGRPFAPFSSLLIDLGSLLAPLWSLWTSFRFILAPFWQLSTPFWILWVPLLLKDILGELSSSRITCRSRLAPPSKEVLLACMPFHLARGRNLPYAIWI